METHVKMKEIKNFWREPVNSIFYVYIEFENESDMKNNAGEGKKHQNNARNFKKLNHKTVLLHGVY